MFILNRTIFLVLLLLKIFFLKAQPPSDSLKALKLMQKGDSLLYEGEFNAASGYYNAIINGYKDKRATSIYYTAICKEAEGLMRQGEYDGAQELTINEINKINRDYKKNEMILADLKGVHAMTWLNKGRTDLAGKLLKEALDLYFKTGKNTSSGAARILNNLGLVYWNTGNLEVATDYLIQALNLKIAIYGAGHMEVAGAYNNLGLVYLEESPAKALDLFKKASDIYAHNYRKEHPVLISTLNNIALADQKLGNYEGALDNLNKILALRIKINGFNHVNVAFTHAAIAGIYQQQGEFEKAKTSYTLAEDIYLKQYGLRHPELVNIYNQFSSIAMLENDLKVAAFYVEKALKSNLSDYSPSEPYPLPKWQQNLNPDLLLFSLLIKARVYEKIYFTQSLKLKDLKYALALSYISDSIVNHIREFRVNRKDKIKLGQVSNELYEDAIRYCAQLVEITGKKRFWKDAFFFSERNKSAVLNQAIAEAEALQFAGIPESLLEKERKLKAEVALCEQVLATRPEAAKEKEYRDKLFNANKQYEDLKKQFEKEYPEYYNFKNTTKFPSIAEFQSFLSPGKALVSYFVAERSGRLYTFFISKTKFLVFNNPLKNDFFKYVKSLRNGIRYKSKETFIEASALLGKQLLPFPLSGLNHITFLPDAQLGAIPFETLLAGNIKNTGMDQLPYLIKKVGISYNYSGILIMQGWKKKDKEMKSKSIFLCAPVTFADLPVSSLPGTEEEVNKIATIQRQKGNDVKVCIGEQANERVIKSGVLKNYKYLHFATHGFTNEVHPELSEICLFKDKDGNEDGHLYSGEIYNLQIDADLVTLSACETGLGKVTKGEGVIGLTRSLLFAGARNVIVSLWTVNDESTSKLMVDFYTSLFEQEISKSEALRQAKLKMIKEGFAEKILDPYYWSPFILIGE